MCAANARAAKIGRVRSNAISQKGVRLVKAFSQMMGQEIQALNAMDHRGACRALCTQWIIHRHEGRDFWGAMQDEAVFRQIIHQQRSWDKFEKKEKTQEDWITLVLSTADLKVRRRVDATINPEIEIEDSFPFHLYRAEWTPKGSHAMAAHFQGPWVSFFDPNVGHFHFDSRALYMDFLNTTLMPDRKYGTGKTLTHLRVREID